MENEIKIENTIENEGYIKNVIDCKICGEKTDIILPKEVFVRCDSLTFFCKRCEAEYRVSKNKVEFLREKVEYVPISYLASYY